MNPASISMIRKTPNCWRQSLRNRMWSRCKHQTFFPTRRRRACLRANRDHECSLAQVVPCGKYDGLLGCISNWGQVERSKSLQPLPSPCVGHAAEMRPLRDASPSEAVRPARAFHFVARPVYGRAMLPGPIGPSISQPDPFTVGRRWLRVRHRAANAAGGQRPSGYEMQAPAGLPGPPGPSIS